MCDYSLMHVKSRAAKVEDVLTTSSFIGTVSHGFTPVGEPEVAACLLPGTEIAFTETVKTRESYHGPSRDTGQKLARFRQINLDAPHVHHDALELANGEVILLNDLAAGQKATVLQLPAAPATPEEARAQERLEVTA
jgi:hypothetical protein